MRRSLGQWNAYVEAAMGDPADLATRGAEVPDDLKEQVRSHVRTVAAIARHASKKLGRKVET